jgi:hypothetical protein
MPSKKHKTIQDHIHIWIRWKPFAFDPKEMVFKCDDPDCEKTSQASKLKGKRSICAVCKQNELILTSRDLKMERPRCVNCSLTKEAQQKRKLEDVLTGFLEQGIQK